MLLSKTDIYRRKLSLRVKVEQVSIWPAEKGARVQGQQGGGGAHL